MMSEPLSIAANVAGLITLAEVITVTGYEYVRDDRLEYSSARIAAPATG